MRALAVARRRRSRFRILFVVYLLAPIAFLFLDFAVLTWRVSWLPPATQELLTFCVLVSIAVLVYHNRELFQIPPPAPPPPLVRQAGSADLLDANAALATIGEAPGPAAEPAPLTDGGARTSSSASVTAATVDTSSSLDGSGASGGGVRQRPAQRPLPMGRRSYVVAAADGHDDPSR